MAKMLCYYDTEQNKFQYVEAVAESTGANDAGKIQILGNDGRVPLIALPPTVGGTVQWNDVANKPATFPVAVHGHNEYALTDHNHDAAYAASNHNHNATYQPLDADLTAIAGLTTTAYGRGFLDLADGAAARTKIGTGTIATQAASAVAITGGSIDGTAVGATTRAAGGFTALTATSSLGYAAGAGGTSTQPNNKTTAAPALNKATGTVTMSNAALAAAATVSFTMANSVVEANDLIVCSHHATGTFGAYTINARASATGTITFTVRNNTAGSLSEAIVIKFAVIKAVVA